MAALDPSKSLKYVAEQVDQVSGLIGDLTDAQWNQPSNCQGWKIADVAAHVVRNGESVLYAALFAAFSASPELEMINYGPASRPRDAEVQALGPKSAAHLQRAEGAAFIAILSRMTPEQLARPARHASGVRPVAWFANK